MAGLLARLGMISMWKDTGECYGNKMPVKEASGREEAL